MSADKEITLIDGSSFLFRAYHAMGQAPLMTSDGRMTQAIFGMTNMLKSLLREIQPVHIAVIMDAKGKTFRHDLYDQYKANRAAMPDDLREQLSYLKQIIPAMGLPLVSVSGVEADDVIGTLSTRAVALNFRVRIVSSDKDLTQLVSDKVEMVDTMKNLRLDPEGVVKKFGVPPQQMIDYLALVGDKSDNIPGVPKVGPKTAVKWLSAFGSLDDIVNHADQITGSVGVSLRAHLDQLRLSKILATIKCDVELDTSPEQLKLGNPDTEALRTYYQDLEFNSWLKELPETDSKETSATVTETSRYETIVDFQTLDDWIEKLNNADIFALDTETTSVDAHQADLVGLSFCVTPGEAAYIPLKHGYPEAPPQLPMDIVLEKLKPILEDPHKAKTGQNLKYDAEVLHYCGIQLNGITHDTMLMSYVLGAGYARHDMDTLARTHLGKETIKFSDIAGTGKQQLTFDQIEIETASQYAAEDADITLQLHRLFVLELEQYPRLKNLFHDIELPLLNVLVKMETNGVKVDADQLNRHSEELAIRLRDIEKQAHAVAGEPFNIGSPKQIQEILYHKQGIPVTRKTPKGQPSTAEHVLQELAENHVLPGLILEHRGLAKLKSTYTDKLPRLVNPKTGRIHTSYHQAVAATGRLSSSDPNLQNIPIRTEEGRRIRVAFIPDKGNLLIAADYSQIELRIMAHLSQDKSLIEAFTHGVDIHSATAAEVFGGDPSNLDTDLRRRAKAINFGLIYGMSAYGLARQLKIDQREAKQYIDIYFDRYPGVRKYMEDTKQLARMQGYVETIYGRRLNLPDIHSRNAARRQYAERTAINAPMQGSAADLVKLAMLAVDQWITENRSCAKVILQVHDELVLEVDKAEAERMSAVVSDLMCSVGQLRVPLVVETGIGQNWKQAH